VGFGWKRKQITKRRRRETLINKKRKHEKRKEGNT
jgi:hypothetical protein